MNSRQRDWEERYAGAPPPASASQVLRDGVHLLPAGGRGLDLACGTGGNALLLASHGMQTEAWDFSRNALTALSSAAQERGLEVATRQCDLLQESLPVRSFDVIIVSYFLERRLFPAIMQALKASGLLYYQTFLAAPFLSSCPQNPAFRLQSGELLRLCRGLELLQYRETRLPAVAAGSGYSQVGYIGRKASG